jgi:predicted metalloprotease with PDZ domain
MFIKRSFLGLLLLACVLTAYPQGKKGKGYQYTIDLTNVVNDKLYVELLPPPASQNEITFYLPKMVPGTYSIEDYGRFVSDFTAADKKGNKLVTEKLNDNAWKIKGAKKLAKISYWVEDSYDTQLPGPEIFQPAGTNIEDGKNFVLNTSGFFGYLDGVKDTPFQFSVIRPEAFYGSSGLIPLQTGKPVSTVRKEAGTGDKAKRVDTFQATNYDELIDSPLMYAKPDTAVIKVSNTEVLIGAYSPNNRVTAKQIAASIREVLMAQKEFLGGKLPVNKYAFIFYFTDQPVTSYGALEHSYSSFYYMPEQTIEEMNQQLRDFAAHEFFHIVTPLTIHSEEIGHFDFNDPKMSQHLWMYEGVTEYFAGSVQVRYGLITPEEYLDVLREKMVTADQFVNDVPFTDISRFTLDKYHDQYGNVYMKGALIGLCLDLKLRKLSGGKSGLPDLLMELSKKYGKEKSFRDDVLFDEITAMTYPQIGEFFARYVKGTEPLPLAEVLGTAGVLYKDEVQVEDYSMGLSQNNIGITQVNGKAMLEISTTANMNEMGVALGFQNGDVLQKINGETLPDLGPELGAFLQRQRDALPTLKTMAFTVLRKDASGAQQPVELSAPMRKVKVSQKHLLAFDPDATPEQIALRNAWLKK